MKNSTLVNVVAGGDLGFEIDLNEAVVALRHLSPSYEPEIAPGLHFELPDTGVTVMLFRTGKYHLTGGESTEQIQECYAELINICGESMGLKPTEGGAKVRNLVYNGDIGEEVDLDSLASALQEDVVYQPSFHPGLQYRMNEYHGLFMLYRTGSYIYTGNSNADEAQEAIKMFNKELRELLD